MLFFAEEPRPTRPPAPAAERRRRACSASTGPRLSRAAETRMYGTRSPVGASTNTGLPAEADGDDDGDADDDAPPPTQPLAAALGFIQDEVAFRLSLAVSGRYARERLKPHSAQPYLADGLRPADALRYKAAGILPFAVEPAPSGARTCHVLLSRQGDHKSHHRDERSLLLVGGKRENKDAAPLDTALREAREETAGLLGAGRLARARLGQVLWYPTGKFALYLMARPEMRVRFAAHAFHTQPVPLDELKALPAAFAGRVKASPSGPAKPEVTALEVVSLDDVLHRHKSRQLGVAPFARDLVTDAALVRALTQAR